MISFTTCGAEAGAIARPSGAIVAFAPGVVLVGAGAGAGTGVQPSMRSPRVTAACRSDCSRRFMRPVDAAVAVAHPRSARVKSCGARRRRPRWSTGPTVQQLLQDLDVLAVHRARERARAIARGVGVGGIGYRYGAHMASVASASDRRRDKEQLPWSFRFAYGVSCRARAEKSRYAAIVRRFAPGPFPRPNGSPAPSRPCARDSAYVIRPGQITHRARRTLYRGPWRIAEFAIRVKVRRPPPSSLAWRS